MALKLYEPRASAGSKLFQTYQNRLFQTASALSTIKISGNP